jgi:mitochondrial import receptor subunit TOM40
MQASLASDFMYNQMSKDVSASIGYDYMLRQVSLIVLYYLLLASA